MTYRIIKGLRAPWSRHPHRTSLDNLIELAKAMEVGDAVNLTLSEAQTFRTILYALGHKCVSDGWRCEERGKTLVFKL